LSFYFVQFVTGLASASSLFLVASGLSIIFGVTRVVNFAHGAFYMLGAYIGYTLIDRLGGSVGFWPAIVLSAFAVAAIGTLIEMLLLRRIYDAPELFQLLATFAVALVIEDLALLIWGPSDLLGPRAPGFKGAIDLLGQRFPTYDLLLIALAPLVLALIWLIFRRTTWGVLVRAATQDREMVAALGVNQKWLFTSVFALGVFLAGLGGALELPRQAANHTMDLQVITEALVVVVIGGLGSVPGTFLAAIIVSELNAFGILVFPKISIVLVFLVMAIVLIVRPWGLLGRAEAAARTASGAIISRWRPFEAPGRIAAALAVVIAALLPIAAGNYLVGVATEVLIFMLYAASLHFLLAGAGLASFGHAAYFGLGSYGAAIALKSFGLGHGDRDCRRDRSRTGGRARFRLVLRAPFRRLFRHADPCLRPDRLVNRLSMDRRDGRRQRHHRRLAERLGRFASALLLADARAERTQWSRGWLYQTLKLFNGYRVVRPAPKAAPAG
jgi:branched-chain amino acid transport system permease protein